LLTGTSKLTTDSERYPTPNVVFSLRPQPLTYSRAGELVKKHLKAIGLNPKQYTPYSKMAASLLLFCLHGN